MVPIAERMSAPQDTNYDVDRDRLERIRWMEKLVVAPPFQANQTRLLRYIELLKTSDVDPGNWDNYDEYRRGEMR